MLLLPGRRKMDIVMPRMGPDKCNEIFEISVSRKLYFNSRLITHLKVGGTFEFPYQNEKSSLKMNSDIPF